MMHPCDYDDDDLGDFQALEQDLAATAAAVASQAAPARPADDGPMLTPAMEAGLRLLQRDHAPDGWPAVRMREITALLGEVDKLRRDLAENEALRERMAALLSRTAVALRGPEPPLTRWSWHDVPDRAAAAVAAIDVMQRAAFMAADPERHNVGAKRAAEGGPLERPVSRGGETR